MKTTAIIYGSTTGTTADVAQRIAREMGIDEKDVYEVRNVGPDIFNKYDRVLIGSSTWGSGEVQDDMYDFLDGTQSLALDGKEIALFGCGDEGMSDTFCDALGDIYEKLKGTGATFVGEFNDEGYSYDHSRSKMPDGKMIGLVLDQVNHPEYSDARIKEWVKELK